MLGFAAADISESVQNHILLTDRLTEFYTTEDWCSDPVACTLYIVWIKTTRRFSILVGACILTSLHSLILHRQGFQCIRVLETLMIHCTATAPPVVTQSRLVWTRVSLYSLISTKNECSDWLHSAQPSFNAASKL